MKRIEVKEINNQEIIYLSFKDLSKDEDIKELIDEAIPMIRSKAEYSVLLVTDLSNMRFNNTVREYFVNFTKNNRQYVKASALIGASSLHKIMINGINRVTGRKLKSFKTEEEATAWLFSI